VTYASNDGVERLSCDLEELFNVLAPQNEMGKDEFFYFLSPLVIPREQSDLSFSILTSKKKMDKYDFCTALARFYLDKTPTKFQDFFGVFDWEAPPPLFPTQFQMKKFRHAFQMQDITRDGKINLDDYITWGKRAAKAADVKWSRDLKKRWTKCYEQLYPDGEENFECWMEKLTKQMRMKGHQQSWSEFLNLWKSIFPTIDANKDGVVNWKEYSAFVGGLGVSHEQAAETFKMFDTDDNGVLSKDEFCIAYNHYFFDPEPSIYMHFYGKINWTTEPADDVFEDAGSGMIFERKRDLSESGGARFSPYLHVKAKRKSVKRRADPPRLVLDKQQAVQ